MSTRPSFLVLAFALTVTVAGCGGNEQGPSPVSQAPPGGVSQEPSSTELSVQCEVSWDGHQCTAVIGRFSSSPRDVTASATWSTSDTRIATVDPSGFVTPRGTGTIAVRAFYLRLQAFASVPVTPTEVPWQFRTFWGNVTDAQGGAALSGVTVQILDGPNANRTTTTRSDGFYQMENMGLSPATPTFAFRVRFSKPGYTPIERTASMSTEKFNELSLSLTKS